MFARVTDWIEQYKQILGAILVTAIVAFGFGFMIDRNMAEEKLQMLQEEISRQTVSWKYKLFSPAPERLYITIEADDFEKIVDKRNEAVAQDILLASDDDFVPATIRYDEEEVQARLRLKGDWVDHLLGDKWSYRIHVEDEGQIMGMKKFSIQDPKTRAYANEWLMLQALKKEDVISLRYDFAEVFINGESKGVHAIEEFFAPELLENNQRPIGAIAKFNEDLMWQELATYREVPGIEAGMWYSSLIEPFQQNRVEDDPLLSGNYERVRELLEQYRQGNTDAVEAFDVDRWSTLLALSDVFSSRHGLRWHNLRFYLHEETGLIEPVPFDLEPGEQLKRLLIDESLPELELIFNNQELQQQYVKKLARFSHPTYLASLLEDNAEEIHKIEQTLGREGHVDIFNQEAFLANQNFIQNKLQRYPAIRAFAYPDRVEIVNLQELPIEVTDLGNRDLNRGVTPLYIPPLNRDEVQDPVTAAASEDYSDDGLRVVYRYVGLDEAYEVEAIPMSASVVETGKLPDFVIEDVTKKSLIIPEGSWVLDQKLVVPESYTLHVSPGTKLDLVKQAKVVAHGSVLATGEEGKPIKFDSSDKSGQSITLMNKINSPSYFGFVVFRNQTSPVLAKNASLTLDHVLFDENESQADVQLYHSRFVIRDVTFDRPTHRALDSRYSHGVMENVMIAQPNQAMKLVGSYVEMSDVNFVDHQVQWIDVGMASTAITEGIEMSIAHVLLTESDPSYLEMQGSHM